MTGHSIDEEDFGERTGLMVAAAFNNYELTSLLLGKGASISHYDQDNMEAIDFTIDKRIIEFLYSAGGRTKEQKKKGL